MERRDGINHPELMEPACDADDASNIVESTDRHAAKMEALPANSPGFSLGFDKRDFLSCRRKPYRGYPPGRTPAKNNDHTVINSEDFDALIHRLGEELPGEGIDLDNLLAPDLPDRDVDLPCFDLDVLTVRLEGLLFVEDRISFLLLDPDLLGEPFDKLGHHPL